MGRYIYKNFERIILQKKHKNMENIMEEMLNEILNEFKKSSDYFFIYLKMLSRQLMPKGETKEVYVKAIDHLIDDSCEVTAYKYCLSKHVGKLLDDTLIETVKNEAHNLAELMFAEAKKEYREYIK